MKKTIRGVGSRLEAELGLPDMATAPEYQETGEKLTIPGKEGGDNTGMRTDHIAQNRTKTK